MRLLLFALAFAPVAADAQTFVGQAVAVDGDTLDMTGLRVRLFGVDAVELGQTCERDGVSWHCGEDAKAQLAELVAGRMVMCEARDVDAYGRTVAVCRVGRVDLSQAMAWAGFAVALEDFSGTYIPSVEAAQAQRAGIWASEFAEPRAWRAANPREAGPQRAVPREAGEGAYAEARPMATARRPDAHYRNCSEARAAGVAPLYRGQPGYRSEMDGDGDGIACEPYRGRR